MMDPHDIRRVWSNENDVMLTEDRPLFFGESGACVDRIEAASVVILPLCYEHAVSYGTGTREGPLHLLEASAQLEVMDEETFRDWRDIGIFTVEPLWPDPENPERAVEEMYSSALTVLQQGKRLLCLGGDHAVSIGPIRAASEMYPDIGVLQIDAHLDLRNTWNGSPLNHACVMRRVVEDMKLPTVQVGIRSVSPEEHRFVLEKGLRPIYAAGIDPFDDSWMDEAIDRLPEHVYVTIDLDGLDPSVMPGVGTPEPGGLSYRQILALLRRLGEKRRVVAADINELSKIPHTQVSEFTAAKIAVKIFVHCFAPSNRSS
uniref:Agmatinase n=1 Tax=Desulfatirhabdium butyrativorans TaxID=340467 RepID=A0A7C4MPD2_9BACT